MRRALEAIYPPSLFERRTEPDFLASPEERVAVCATVNGRILIDGLALKHFPYPHTGVVKGDARSLCIAMASIIAKVTRDRMMDDLDRTYPCYGFAQHKGYGTEVHREAVPGSGVALSTGRCFCESCSRSGSIPANGLSRRISTMPPKRHPTLDRVLGRLDTLDSVNFANLVQRLARERGLFPRIFSTRCRRACS